MGGGRGRILSPGRWWEGGAGSQSQVAACGRREGKDREAGCSGWEEARARVLKMCLFTFFLWAGAKASVGGHVSRALWAGSQLGRGGFALGHEAGPGLLGITGAPSLAGKGDVELEAQLWLGDVQQEGGARQRS